jgi:hypothetical protein
MLFSTSELCGGKRAAAGGAGGRKGFPFGQASVKSTL